MLSAASITKMHKPTGYEPKAKPSANTHEYSNGDTLAIVYNLVKVHKRISRINLTMRAKIGHSTMSKCLLTLEQSGKIKRTRDNQKETTVIFIK